MFLHYIVAILSILLYLHGFFPIPVRPSEKWPPNEVTSTHPKYQKAVVIIIDALRLDFVTESQTPFLWKIHQDMGCFIELKVETPTVTLPRIKALTTGNVPQFVDIIFNLASPTKVDDSFIHRAHANGKKIVFYGDDIWVKLFPEQFMRSEGTSSFFVNDYTEVDDNVTRNVWLENKRDDWDIMILHYLGLDHIGHVYGPKSPLILSKLTEMDSIILEIYRSNPNTLFVITGDHGMRDSGGHGGSTFPETHVPLIILGMPCTDDKIAQIDIPANLAILLGFDIPATSIGQLHSTLLNQLSEPEYLKALKYNTLLLTKKIDLCGESIETANHFLDLFLLNKNLTGLADKAAGMYQSCAKRISERLQKISVQQKIDSLVIATLNGIIVLMKILQKLCLLQVSLLDLFVVLSLLILQFMDLHSYFGLAVALFVILLCFYNLKYFSIKHLKSTELSFLTIMSIIHPFIFLSSSFLEEEDQFWHFFTNTFIAYNIFTNKKHCIKWGALLVAIRFVKTLNQVGDKWASLPDLADWLLEKENYLYLQLIFIFGLLLTFYSSTLFAKSNASKFFDGCVFILIYAFRSVSKQNVFLGQIIWSLIFLKFILSFLTKEYFLTVWLLIISLLLKPYNIILIPVCVFASQLYQNSLKATTLILSHWWLGNLLFFAQGHDNSLASVDISSGYVGLTQYNPFFVIPQVLCHTYALPVLSHLLLFTNKNVNVSKSFSIFIFFRLYVVLIVFIITFLHRNHLFIWSVFSPKMFVEASHFGFLFIEVCTYYVASLIKKSL